MKQGNYINEKKKSQDKGLILIILFRNMVKQFNIALEKRCNSSDDVTWLNFFDSLLTDDGNGLRKEYELDGTHMNPSYLTLLEKAINSAN